MAIKKKKTGTKSAAKTKDVAKNQTKKKHTIKLAKSTTKLIEEAEEKFGANVLTVGFPKHDGNKDDWNNINRFSSTIPSLDIKSGGGLPVGRYIEIQGKETSFKSTISLLCMTEFIKKYNKSCILCDVEGTFTAEYGEKLNIPEDKFIYNSSAGLEETTQVILDAMEDPNIKFAIIDSIEALTNVKEVESDMDESTQLGIRPRLLGEFFRKYFALNNKLRRSGEMPFTIIGINQLRDGIGPYAAEFAPGGRSKDFAASMIIRLRPGDWITEGSGDNKVVVGSVIKFTTQKNKTFQDKMSGEFHMYKAPNKEGVPIYHCDRELSIILEAVNARLIDRRGAFYTIDGVEDQKFQGKDPLISYLKANPEIIADLTDRIADLKEGTK